jgi:ZIP family zinc transporter
VNPVLFSLLALVSTSAGGLCAIRLRDRLHLILGFTAGALLGVVVFDLLPEIFKLSHEFGQDDCREAMVALAVGFLILHGLEKFVLVHHAHEDDYAPHRHQHAGALSAAALIAHSVMDGMGIGLAFQVSPAVGFTVALAVIAHDFCDGLNTASLMLMHGNSRRGLVAVLALDAVAPVLGATVSLALSVPPQILALYLGLFAGFLLYISASDILPEAHSRAGSAAAMKLIGFTVAGMSFIYVVARVAD